ncbi:induced myeloid leukemia cell differentiation protein Mcl-1 homolog [Dunckerocampus dactyliophorus]|uniref:induced myeloid leukemia cell differentiation protein Mcl-1 homolog n=1 Tax=Dunckerocampus dactyliophorus TaxID=161453 RepID=UPI0024050F02|nr:induced myeloid leukemia cell differentiation protein Mcl-1 homolog [Dunckerocampus dactyliophorus]
MEKSGVMGTFMLCPGAVGESSMPVAGGDVNGSTPKRRSVGLEVMLQGDLPAKSHPPDSGGTSTILLRQTRAIDDVLDRDTRRLISRCLTNFTGLSKADWKQSKAQSTLQKVVTELVDKHRLKYNGIINQLSLDQRGYDMTFVGDVAQSLFADGTTNWGRIASLVAFGAVVSHYLMKKEQACCVEMVAQEISNYLLSHQRTWLVVHNSWDGFAEFFEKADPETRVRNALLAFVGLSSVMAMLTFLLR